VKRAVKVRRLSFSSALVFAHKRESKGFHRY
jgi:hypothetical protein